LAKICLFLNVTHVDYKNTIKVEDMGAKIEWI